jgi:hypothetical protein
MCEVMYKIVRFYYPGMGENHDVKGKRDLTLKEAQKHCCDPTTRKEGVYFDGYTEQ